MYRIVTLPEPDFSTEAKEEDIDEIDATGSLEASTVSCECLLYKLFVRCIK